MAIWWIVTIREDGDDEDSLYIVQEKDEETAVEAAKEMCAHDRDYESAEACSSCGEAPCAESCGAGDYPTFYVNHVIRCVGGKPEHVRTVQL